MTSETDPKSASPDGIDDARERCLLYLLGELNADQATAFERELEQSQQLQHELIVQSNLLCSLSGDQPTVDVAHLPATHSAWRIVATIAAMAACVAIAFFAWPNDSRDATLDIAAAAPEGLLIAQAWADGPLDDLISDWNDEASELDETLLPSEDDSSSLSWIVAAAEAGVVIDG